jgi:putative glutamine amidotransferase
VGHRLEHRQPEHGSVTTHRVETAPHSRLRATLGGPALKVNSFHHQAIKTLGEDLSATAWAQDGTIEAVEQTGARLVLGVQWHAEGLRAHAPLFDLLVEASSAAQEPAAEPRRLTSPRRATRSRRARDPQPLAQAAV